MAASSPQKRTTPRPYIVPRTPSQPPSRWLVADIAAGLWASLLEALPGDEREAGVFLAGMTWAFVLFWAMLVLVTYLWSVALR